MSQPSNSGMGGLGDSPTRREFLKTALVATGAAVLAAETPALAKQREELVDVNVSLGQWPVRRLPLDEPELLVAKLRSRGVTQAWAGSFGGVLHKDLAGVNARLAEECKRYGRGLLLPFGSINPKLPGWEHELDRCAKVHQMRGIRLHPNYHGYTLSDPQFGRLLKLAAERRLIVQIAVVMEDERMMNPLLRVEAVDTAPLAELAKQTPGLRIVLLNGLRTLRGDALRKLVAAGDISVEIAMLEGMGGLENLLSLVPSDRILFGSHAPLFYFEAAELKLKESNLTPAQLRAIKHGNAAKLTPA